MYDSMTSAATNTSQDEKPAQSAAVVIHQRHLVMAANTMAPSVSESERNKFNAM